MAGVADCLRHPARRILALRELAGDRAEVALCSPRSDFHDRPSAAGEPFAAGSLLRYDSRVEAGAVIAMPRLEGRRVAGIPHDADGFVPVAEHGRVPDMDRVFAVGDVTTFPVKQGAFVVIESGVSLAHGFMLRGECL